jgi:hypothetical protein
LFRSIPEPDEPTPVSADPDPELPPPSVVVVVVVVGVVGGGGGGSEELVEGVVAPPSLGADIEPIYEGFLEGEETLVEGDDTTGELILFIGRGT